MLRFVDNNTLLTKNECKLEEMLNDMDILLRKDFNLKINKNKTKAMRCK